MRYCDIAIIGGGPAGLAAAISAKEQSVKDVLIIERDARLGGILNQCVHTGFGLHKFKAELSGPEYAQRYINKACDMGVSAMLNTMVLSIDKDRTLSCISPELGLQQIKAGAIILAMGCRERPRGNMNTPGYRPAGIFSAGTAQRLVNIENLQIGKKIVIVGSGDIGLIMARRLTLEGAKVQAVVEIMPYSGGLKRNIVQCLDDFGIPLLLSHSVIDIKGEKRVSGVTISKVDESLQPIAGTEQEIECDTLLYSVGLIPENELALQLGLKLDPRTGGTYVNENLQTEVDGIFACGNVLHVHDLADNVSFEAELAGKAAAEFLTKKNGGVWAQKDLILPQKTKSYGNKPGSKETTCISCPLGCPLSLEYPQGAANENNISVKGNKCPRGKEYGINEVLHPMRMLTSAVKIDGALCKKLPVRTSAAVPKEKLQDCMAEIKAFTAKSPVKMNDVLIKNIAGTGADLIATEDM